MKINKEIKEKIILYFELGLPVADVCILTGLSVSDLHEISSNDKSIKKAKEAGAKVTNIRVIEALLKSACGYDIIDEDTTVVKGRNDAIITDTTTKKKKHISPNINAIKYWLDNRASSEWKDSLKEVENKMNIKISVDGKNIEIE